MSYVTQYQRVIKPRKGPYAGQTVTKCLVYQTKGDSPLHQRLCEAFAGITRKGDDIRIITDFVPGMPLERPIVTGGVML